MDTLSKGNSFELKVYEILYHTIPISIEFYYGGNDRGRDILLQYVIHGQKKQVIVECKNYKSVVTQKDIASSINWAVANRPDLYYIWVSSHLSPSTKDYIEKISTQYNLAVLYEEKESISKYKEALLTGDDTIFAMLKAKIEYTIHKNSKIFNDLEYNSKILMSSHYLLDRVEERKILKNNSIFNYYITGASGLGKTQLAKVTAKYYYKKGYKIFWHRIISENENEYQVRCFLESLGTFFKANFSDDYMCDYLSNHGSYITNQLINIFNSMINTYHPIFFLDDIHKCRLDNTTFLELLYQLIQNDNCRCYFLGWFNIFDISKLNIQSKLNYIEILPLDNKYIRQIAKHSNMKISNESLDIIVEKSQGFPGLAEIMPKSEELIYINGLEQTFEKLLGYLTESEKELLIALVISRIPLPKNILYDEYYEASKQLERRKIVKNEGNTLVVHDRFKDLIKKSYSLINSKSFLLLEKCSSKEAVLLIDLLYIYLEYNMHEKIRSTLNAHFDYLVKKGFDITLFNFIKRIEEHEPIGQLDFIIKKMILVERKAEYDLLGMYLDITENMIDIQSKYFYLREYLKYRYLYFKCMFEQMFNFFWKNFEDIQSYPKEIYLQILFIIGRTYYVQGDLETATEIYYYIFNIAYTNSLSDLCIKALHRICIIEEKLEMYECAKGTIEQLLKNKYFISSKRQAFAYFRIAKCYKGLNDVESAHKKNDKSIEIKESLNAQRGLVFSFKLRAQIYIMEDNLKEARLWAQRAYSLAQDQSIDKEIVSTGIILAKILLLSDNVIEATPIIEKCIYLAKSYTLVYRLKTLKNICKDYRFFLMYNIIEIEYESAVLKLKKEQADYKKYLEPIITKKIKKDRIKVLFQEKRSLSQELLYIL
jgi:ATP-dependent Lon protease, bacterial type